MSETLILQAEQEFRNALDHLKGEFAGLQIGRASAALVENIDVEAYGSVQPLKALASISIPDPKTIQIQPWDRSQLQAVEKAIRNSDINITPSNDGIVIRLNIPPLTEERRADLTKVVHRLAEEARISVRQARQRIHEQIKEAHKNGKITEDDKTTAEKKLQEKVDNINKEIESLAKAKEAEVMKV
jgi:ribosome recycling factor